MLKSGHLPVTVSIKGKPESSETMTLAHNGPTRTGTPPVSLRRKAKKKKRKPANPLSQLAQKAHRLIGLGGSRWGPTELEASYLIRDSVLELVASAGPYERRKADGYLRELQKLNALVRDRMSQERRGTGTQHDHPDRNRVTEFGAAGGRITWATPRK
jgi:hypothetical protein